MAEEHVNQPIRLVLKEKGKIDRDTKDGEKTKYRAVFIGSMNEMQVRFSAITEKPEQLDEIALPKLGAEIFVKIVPSPQTTLGDEPEKKEKEPEAAQKKKPGKRNKVIDVSHRLTDGTKEITRGGSEEVLDQLRGT